MKLVNFRAGFALFPALCMLFWGCQQGNPTADTLADKTPPASFNLDFEKYQLGNGLDVVLHQDQSDPIVAVALLFHVGSNREKPGKTGFAHFFEHMLFQNSENVGKGNFMKRMNELGATFNGGTFQDGTVYFEVAPKDGLEQVLWMESDRLGFFINTVTIAGLENEKQVVKNEKRQRVDNQPYGHTDYVVDKNLYPPDHPYHWQVIGSLEDLQAATLADVREFYEKFYGPNNATLVIAGDIDKGAVKSMVEKYFGEIKAKPELEPLKPRPGVLNETVKLYHEDNFAKLPELRLTFPTVDQGNNDQYALNVLASLLADGRKAPLYKTLVEEKKLAPGVSVNHNSLEIAGKLTIRVRAFDQTNLSTVHDAVFEALANFEANGFEDADLQRIKNLEETNFYNGLTSLFGRAFQLALFNEFAGDPGLISDDLKSRMEVTREDVMRVYQTYIKGKSYLATSFVPKGQTGLILADSKQADIKEEAIVQGAEKPAMAPQEEKAAQKTPSSFDRTTVPPLGDLPLLNPPTVWQSNMDNGLKVLGIEHSELPLVQFSIQFRGGHFLDPADKSGTARVLAAMFDEGTQSKTPAELEAALGQLGAAVSVSAGREFFTINANCLARNFEPTLNLVFEMLLEPRWDQTEFDRVKKSSLSRIQQASANPTSVAQRVLATLLYGENHILGKPVAGTEASVSSISIDDLKAYYAKNLSPSVASFHVAGAVGQQAAVKALKPLAEKWQAVEVAFPNYDLPPAPQSPALYFVDVPGAKQSVIQIGKLGPNGRESDFVETTFANFRLGGGSGSLLFRVLRLEKGYTYGASATLARDLGPGQYTAFSRVRANVTMESVAVFKDLLENYGTNFNEEDLSITQKTLIRNNTREFETLSNLMNMLENISGFDLPPSYIKDEESVINGMTLDQTKAIYAKHLNPQQLTYLVVGDAATQLERMKEAGLGKPVLLDRDGRKATGSSQAGQ